MSRKQPSLSGKPRHHRMIMNYLSALFLFLLLLLLSMIAPAQSTTAITVQEADGSPKKVGVTTIVVPSGALTISGSTATIATGAGGVTTSSAGTTTDNALARWDGTTGLVIQNSTAILSDTGDMTITSTNADAATPLLVDAGNSTISNNPGFTVILPATGSRKGFQLKNGSAVNTAWASFEFFGGTPGIALGTGGGARDTGLFRDAPGVLGLNNGTTGGGTIRAIANPPAQITANQDNYNPGGTADFQRWSTDASRNITGMTFSTTQLDGQQHLICNVGAQNIVLQHQVTSTAANQFLNSTAADITLAATQCADAIYDGTTSRWRVFKRN